jgi:hypothetical protein
MTSGGDDSAADLAPREADLASCAPPAGNLLVNASFESGGGSARNTGAPASSIASWDGCCNLDSQGLTTTWQVTQGVQAARCGGQALSVTSTAAHGDVLNQILTISDGAGRDFTLTAWARVSRAEAGGGYPPALTADLFDLTGSRILVTAPPLADASPEWRQVTAGGQLPQGAAPRVQVRLYARGTVTALVDDVALTLR